MCRSLLKSFRVLGPDKDFELVTDSETVPVIADPKLVERIIYNLLGNATKFTLSRGEIRLRIEQRPGEVRLICTDTGMGIAADQLDSIFEKFRQGESIHQGLGVGRGLAFCKLAAEAMGGSIAVDSTEGKGSKFTVCLPVTPPA